MLMGEFNYAVDEKGRLNFPARFRDEIGGEFVVACWLDNCLVAYRTEDWRAYSAAVKAASTVKSRNVLRFLCATAITVQPDRQGRILLPADHRKHAGLDRDVTILGVDDHAEIWNTAAWQAVKQDMSSESLEAAMSEMGL